MNDSEMNISQTQQGWGMPFNSRKWHYFVNSRSLCNRWLYDGDLDPDDIESPDNCRACYKRRQAQLANAAKTE